MLSTRLGDRDFFYGQQPSTIDAIVYSYLAPLLKTPLPNPVLQNHLKACTNLVKYVSRISQRYFENEYQTYEKHKAEKNAERSRRDSESEFPNKRRNQILAALVATVAMTGYALSTGIVEVKISLYRKKIECLTCTKNFCNRQNLDINWFFYLLISVFVLRHSSNYLCHN